METTDFLALYGAFLSTVLFAWSIYVFLSDRSKVAVEARYLPDLASFIIEVVNYGRRPMTVVGGGIAGLGEGIGPRRKGYAWPADNGFPCRLGEGDSTYVQVWWGNDVHAREFVSYAWVRDAKGTIHSSPLTGLPKKADRWPQRIERFQMPTDVMAMHFSSAAQFDHQDMLKSRLVEIDARVELFKSVARHEAERKRRERHVQEGKDSTSER